MSAQGTLQFSMMIIVLGFRGEGVGNLVRGMKVRGWWIQGNVMMTKSLRKHNLNDDVWTEVNFFLD